MMEYLSTKMPVVMISLEIISHPPLYCGLSSVFRYALAASHGPWCLFLDLHFLLQRRQTLIVQIARARAQKGVGDHQRLEANKIVPLALARQRVKWHRGGRGFAFLFHPALDRLCLRSGRIVSLCFKFQTRPKNRPPASNGSFTLASLHSLNLYELWDERNKWTKPLP